MSQFLHDHDDAKAAAIPRFFPENSRAKNLSCQTNDSIKVQRFSYDMHKIDNRRKKKKIETC